MKAYPKIQSVFKRDEKTFKFVLGEYALPEFEYLAHNDWIATEKIDGTNIRVIWQPGPAGDVPDKIDFRGRTDKASIPPFLLEKLHQLFPVQLFEKVFPTTPVCLYGEGYGAKIQKGGGNYIADGVGFVLFDVLIDEWWLRRHNMAGIAASLNISTVPIVRTGTLQDAVDLIKAGITSTWGDFPAEGIVLKPAVELRMRSGARVITKMKHKDFS